MLRLPQALAQVSFNQALILSRDSGREGQAQAQRAQVREGRDAGHGRGPEGSARSSLDVVVHGHSPARESRQPPRSLDGMPSLRLKAAVRSDEGRSCADHSRGPASKSHRSLGEAESRGLDRWEPWRRSRSRR